MTETLNPFFRPLPYSALLSGGATDDLRLCPALCRRGLPVLKVTLSLLTCMSLASS